MVSSLGAMNTKTGRSTCTCVHGQRFSATERICSNCQTIARVVDSESAETAVKWGLSTTSQLLAASRWEGKRIRRVARTRPPLSLFISTPRLPGVQKIFEMTQLQKRKRHL